MRIQAFSGHATKLNSHEFSYENTVAQLQRPKAAIEKLEPISVGVIQDMECSAAVKVIGKKNQWRFM